MHIDMNMDINPLSGAWLTFTSTRPGFLQRRNLFRLIYPHTPLIPLLFPGEQLQGFWSRACAYEANNRAVIILRGFQQHFEIENSIIDMNILIIGH